LRRPPPPDSIHAALFRQTDDELDLARRIFELEQSDVALGANLATLEAKLAAVLARLPRLPPENWLRAKQVAGLTGYSIPSIYKWARAGRVLSTKVGGEVYIDPASLPSRRI
jgi:hypothetical protein